MTRMKKNKILVSTVFDEFGRDTAIMFDDRGWIEVENYLSERSASHGHDRWCRWAHQYSKEEFLRIAGINQ